MKRFTWAFCLVLGVGFLIAAGFAGAGAASQVTAISAFRTAGSCPPGAAPGADCRQYLVGTVTGVTEYGGKNPVYAMDVQTAAGPMNLTFGSDSAMLAYATDGERAVVGMWRGSPVSASVGGRTQATADVPETAFANDLARAAQALGVGVFSLFGAIGLRRRRMAGRQPILRPAAAAWGMGGFLAALIILVGGLVLSGHSSRLRVDLIGAAVALAVDIGLSVWLGLAGRRRNRMLPPTVTALVPPAPVAARPVRPAREARRAARRAAGQPPVPLRTRLHPARWLPVARSRAMPWLVPVLTVAVLFGIALTSQDGPAARAFRHAPACAGQANLATCVGDFTAVVNGVRTSAGGGSYADVSYVTANGAINAWARFDGSGSAIARTASADQSQQTPLTIRVWRRTIIGASLGGHFQWAQGDPPGDAVPAVFLAVSFALLLLAARLRLHRLSRGRPRARRRLILEDAGQVAGAAAAVAVLAYGYSQAAFLALAVLAWMAVSAWRALKAARVPLALAG